MLRLLRALALALVLSALIASAAQAKTCAAYPNQAAAQRGHDTRDGDSDGIFCEALPCPCLKPGARRTPGAAPAPAAPALPKARGVLGISIPLHAVSRRSGCRTHGGLPDQRCTPGARFSRVTRGRVCQPGYSRSARNVSSSTKAAVYAAYGM